jgi:hypothetical protein
MWIHKHLQRSFKQRNTLIMEALFNWLNQFTSHVSNEKEVENTFTPNEPQKSLRIAKTVGEENRVSFNETFLFHKRELDKLKFNK